MADSHPDPRDTAPDTSTGFGFGLHHVLICLPPGGEDACRSYYVDVLGFVEVAKPTTLAARGGLWVRADGLEIHLGVEEDFTPQRKAHPGILVRELDILAERITSAGYAITWDENLPGHRRFHTFDNHGNRLEFLTPA
ncbi:glyoxalase [Nocardiopsis eucommiae]|uniref:glyoxalase n=1 Tax=Nocardiopsis eucommiae TaxID=2831970 RepID=UPI003D752A60